MNADSGRLDITEVPNPNLVGRPFLQVLFSCANAYQRVYRSVDKTFYLARCPRCGKEVRFQVGSQGTNQRVFTVVC
jgi:hypothetical protein